MSANNYDGEMDIELDAKVYPMKVNMAVIGRFNSETGKDYMHVAMAAINALQKSHGQSVFQQAEIMTDAVSMSDAAWLFFFAAKECDKTVTLGEMQEAVLKEGPMMTVEDDRLIQGYPVIFANLVLFATLGAIDAAKKP